MDKLQELKKQLVEQGKNKAFGEMNGMLSMIPELRETIAKLKKLEKEFFSEYPGKRIYFAPKSPTTQEYAETKKDFFEQIMRFRETYLEVSEVLRSTSRVHNTGIVTLNEGLSGSSFYGFARDFQELNSHSAASKFEEAMKHFFERIANFNIPNIIKRTDLPESNDNYPKYVDYITGADLFIRRSTIDNGGLFDPDFFMYFEETEMQYRYAKLGVKRQIINTPQIRHLAGGSSNKNRKHSLSSLILEMKSRYIYCRKVMPSLSYHIIGLMHLLMIPRILVCRSPLNEKKRLIKLIFKNI